MLVSFQVVIEESWKTLKMIEGYSSYNRNGIK